MNKYINDQESFGNRGLYPKTAMPLSLGEVQDIMWNHQQGHIDDFTAESYLNDPVSARKFLSKYD